MIKLAQRMSRLGTETAFEVLAKAQKLEAQGKNIIHLEIGEPDFSRHFRMGLLHTTLLQVMEI